MTVNKGKILRFLRANFNANKLSQAGIALEYVIKKIEDGEFDASDDAKEETIRQQAEEIERLKQKESHFCEKFIQMIDQRDAAEEARKAAERERDKWKVTALQEMGMRATADENRDIFEQLAQKRLEHNTALRECLAKTVKEYDAFYEFEADQFNVDHARTLLAELDRKDIQPPNADRWWCPTCKDHVHPVNVTFQETHDVRSGGCGNPVVGRIEDTQPQPVSDTYKLDDTQGEGKE